MEELQKFLRNNKNRLTDDEFQSMYADSYDMPMDEFTEKYDTVLKEKGVGWSKIRKPKAASVQERIRKEFGDDAFIVPENFRRDVWEEKFQDIPFEQFSENIDKMRQYYEDENKAREYEAGRKRREKEVKNWGNEWFTTPWIRDFMASDYEKRRYIEHPEEALFGEEAPEIGEAKNTRWGAIGDLAAGTAGVATDIVTPFVPGIGWITRSVVGPAIRAGRDVAHKTSNSEYQKDWSDIGTGFWGDIATNAGIEALPNLRHFSRMMKSEKAGRIHNAIEVEDEAKKMKKELEQYVPTPKELKKWSNTELYERIDNMPEGTLKNNMKLYAKDIHSIDRAGLADEWDRANKFVDAFENPEIRNSMKKRIDRDETFTPKIGERSYESKLLIMPKLTARENFVKNIQKFGRNIPAQSTPVLKAGADIVPDKPVNEDIEIRKNWYKKNYIRDWMLGFTPEYKEGDPKWEAFEEEFPERAAEVKRKKEK